MKILIILGYKLLPEGKISKILKNRLDKAGELNNKNNYDIIIVSGGNVEKKTMFSESNLMKKYLIDTFNIDNNMIIEEMNSTDTNQNAIETQKIVSNINKITNITILSSNFHINRVEKVFTYYYKNEYTLYFVSSVEPVCKKREAYEIYLIRTFLKKYKA
tara:strand:+ start:122 stop:601 length:480 start_codon:yes stop_codon:yes gene_type:complete